MIAMYEKMVLLKKELQEIIEELQHLPDGYLLKKGSYYYQVFNAKKKVSITFKPHKIKKLARKKLLTVRKLEIEFILKSPLANLNNIHLKSYYEIIESLPSSYHGLPIEYFYHPSVEPWLATDHKRNMKYPEQLEFECKNGLMVRSKSEMLIANYLINEKMPFKYEIAWTFGNTTIYPDFTVLNPFTGRKIIWEHFGALDKKDYEKAMNFKMKTYADAGLIQNLSLIYTFEWEMKVANRLTTLVNNIVLQ